MIVEYARLGRARKAWADGGKTAAHKDAVLRQRDAWTALFTDPHQRRMATNRSHVIHENIGLFPKPPSLPPQRIITPPRPTFASHTPVNAIVRMLDGANTPLAGRRWPTNQSTAIEYELVRCGDRMDLYRTPGSVLLHRTPGRFDEVVVDPDAVFAAAAWDGAYAWVASLNKGLWAFAPDGTQVVRVEPGVLPPADRDVVICALAPGRVLVVGSFGQKGRAWIAVVERAEGRVTTRVLHKATHVWTKSTPLAATADPAQVFIPDRLTPMPDGTVLVWRTLASPLLGARLTSNQQQIEQVRMTPLRVDPAKGVIGIYKPPSYFRRPSYDLELPDEYLADRTAVIDGGLFAAEGKKLPNGRSVLRLCTTYDPFIHHAGVWYARSHGDSYHVGSWFRVTPGTFQTEWLGYDPAVFNNSPIWVSAHFGPVAFVAGDLHRIDVTKLPRTADDATRGRSHYPKRPIEPAVTRTQDGGFVFACDEGRLISRRFVRSDEMITYVTHGAYDPSSASTVVRKGLGELVRWPDIRADLGMTSTQFDRLKPVFSRAFKTPPSTVVRAMEKFRAYEAASPAEKPAAEQALRAVLADHTAAVQAADAAVPDKVRALVTPAQYDGIVRLGHGVLYLGGGRDKRE